MDDAIPVTLLSHLDGFFELCLDKSSTLIQSRYLSEVGYYDYLDGVGLAQFTITLIEEHRKQLDSDVDQHIALLTSLKSILERYFQFTDVLIGPAITNLVIYYRSPFKYNHDQYLKEMTKLIAHHKPKIEREYLDMHNEALDNFSRETDKPRDLYKFPTTTKVNEPELFKAINQIKRLGHFDLYIQWCQEDDWRFMPKEIAPFMQTILDYDIGVIRNQILWDLLGYILYELDVARNDRVSFEDLFVNKADYKSIVRLFKENDIIDWEELSMGVKIRGLLEKRTVGSFLAISEILTQMDLIKNEYSRSEQVRAMGKSFNRTVSEAAKSKKSKYHDKMLARLRHILKQNTLNS